MPACWRAPATASCSTTRAARGRSEGHENAFGWRWHRDVRGAVDYLRARGVRRIGLVGLSTGAEAAVTEAADDPRVRAVVADGLQGRTAEDASHLPFGDRITIEPVFAVVGAELRLVRGEKPPPALLDLVHRLTAARPLLVIGTERASGRPSGPHGSMTSRERRGGTAVGGTNTLDGQA
jgi:pimeloyl-ACP methyl ester carboxylesterase